MNHMPDGHERRTVPCLCYRSQVIFGRACASFLRYLDLATDRDGREDHERHKEIGLR